LIAPLLLAIESNLSKITKILHTLALKVRNEITGDQAKKTVPMMGNGLGPISPQAGFRCPSNGIAQSVTEIYFCDTEV